MLIVFICTLIAVVKLTEAGKCGSSYQYDQSVDGYIKLHSMPTDWLSARAKCRQEGAEILSPTSRGAMEAMIVQMTTMKIPCSVFTGIHNTYTPGTFYNVDGKPLHEMSHLFWSDADACPSILSSKNNVILTKDSTLSIASKSDYYSYFCFKKDNNDSADCKCSDANYIFSEKTGSCYRFHPEGKTWHEAAAVCASEGGYLAVINSPAEAEVLKDLFTKYPPEKLDSSFKNSALIGFLDWGNNAGWQTLFGQTLQEAGYPTWSPSQPDHSPHPNGRTIVGVPFCGAIFRTAQLDDIWCDVKFAFICEQPR